MDFDDLDAFDPEQEDEVIERYRNWAIYQDVGSEIYVVIKDNEVYCDSIELAKKEIDKAIKAWNKERKYGR